MHSAVSTLINLIVRFERTNIFQKRQPVPAFCRISESPLKMNSEFFLAKLRHNFLK